MGMFDSPAYDDCRAWIQKKNSKGISWENIRLACKSDLESLDKFLKIKQEDDDWPRMSIKEWISLVDEMILIDFCKVKTTSELVVCTDPKRVNYQPTR